MESKDGYQYVIPFVSTDVKWLHQKPSEGHYAMVTDNTYGHVYESVDVSGKHIYSLMNPIEPYIQVMYNDVNYNGEIADLAVAVDMNDKITEYVFGNAKTEDKVVSMRIYDKKFDASDPTWWHRIRDGMTSESIVDYKDKIMLNNNGIDGIVVDFGKRYN